MKTKLALGAALIAGGLFTQSLHATEPLPVKPGNAGCDAFKHVDAVRYGSRNLVAKLDALAAPTSDVGRNWLVSLRKDAGLVNQNAEKLAVTTAQPDPEVVFNLGKHMNGVTDLATGTRYEAVRPRDNATLEIIQQANALRSEVSFVLANVVQIREETPRCNAARPG